MDEHTAYIMELFPKESLIYLKRNIRSFVRKYYDEIEEATQSTSIRDLCQIIKEIYDVDINRTTLSSSLSKVRKEMQKTKLEEGEHQSQKEKTKTFHNKVLEKRNVLVKQSLSEKVNEETSSKNTQKETDYELTNFFKEHNINEYTVSMFDEAGVSIEDLKENVSELEDPKAYTDFNLNRAVMAYLQKVITSNNRNKS